MINKKEINAIDLKCKEYNATLVCVTKHQDLEDVKDLYNFGQTIFGENRVQDLIEKKEALPTGIQWHLIGHLQRNKVKFIAPFIRMIHSVDSIKLLKEIELEANKANRIIDCLLQFHVAEEESKFGIQPAELEQFMQDYNATTWKNTCIRGIMGMASFTENQNQIRSEFKQLKNIFDSLKTNHFTQAHFDTLSMGMSSDYSIALEEGSTMIRVGSALFN